MAIEDGVDGADRRHPHVAGQAAEQEFADLARTPVRLAAFEINNQALDLPRQLVGIAHRSARAVGRRLQSMFLIPIEDLIAGLARDAELPAQMAHLLALQQAGHETQALLHHRTRSPRHPHLPQAIAWGRCYPCVRNKVSPMSQNAQIVAVPGSRRFSPRGYSPVLHRRRPWASVRAHAGCGQSFSQIRLR
jgi:hypothetical protein